MKKLYVLLSSMIVITTVSAQWSLTGNSIASGNFLGTTNAQNLVFKANNTSAGMIDVTYANTYFGMQTGGTYSSNNHQNSAFGYQSMQANTTGFQNGSVGYASLSSNTSGIQNVAFGYVALQSNTTGSYNVAIGSQTLQFNNGNWNTAIGIQALTHNTSGILNAALGAGSLWSNTSGGYNSTFGANSLYSNTDGSYNTALGYNALFSNNSSGNTAVGYQALYKNTTADRNTALGYQALYSNNTDSGYDNTAVGETALYSNTSGFQNTAIGGDCLYYNTTGTENTATGRDALSANNTGSYNTSNGLGALGYNTTGSYNVGIGYLAFDNTPMYTGNTSGNYNTGVGNLAFSHNTTGSNNTALGNTADVNSGNYTNVTVLGNGALGTASNQVRIGNSSVTSIGGYANWTNISDGRVKKNIKKNVPGLAFINKLTPITYNLDLEAADNILQTTPMKDKKGNIILPSQEEIAAKKQKEQVLYTGFIAQDVEKAAKSLNYDFSGVDTAKNSKDLYGLRYSDFVVPLVKAVQELSAQNDSLKNINNQLQSQLADLTKRVDAIESLQNKNKTNTSTTMRNSDLKGINVNETAKLEQNLPNPFNANTTIHYYIPENANNAKIILTDVSGNILRDITVTGKGTGQILINAGTLASGTYIYSLFIDNMKIQSKQMILTK